MSLKLNICAGMGYGAEMGINRRLRKRWSSAEAEERWTKGKKGLVNMGNS